MTEQMNDKIQISISPMGKRMSSGDCRLILFSKLLKFYGYDYSPSDIFGFCNGLNFEITKMIINDYTCFCVIGRDLSAETEFCKELGISCREHIVNSNADGFVKSSVIEDIRAQLKEGCPVMAVVDRFYLDYLTIARSHFSYHTILIIGYDEAAGEFTVMDALSEKWEHLPVDSFLKAMFETNFMKTEPRGTWYEIRPDGQAKRNISIDIAERLKTQAGLLVKDDGAISFMRDLAEFLDKASMRFENVDNPGWRSYLKFQILLLYRMIFEQEFSGSFYRQVYLDFIQNNCSRETLPGYSRIRKLLNSDIKKWREISCRIDRKRRLSAGEIRSFSDKIREIADLEWNISQMLLDC